MQEKMQIQNIRWYPAATKDQILTLTEAMVKQDSKEILLLPDPASSDYYLGILLAKYYTQELSRGPGVRATKQEGPFQCILVSSTAIRGYLSSLIRKMQAAHISAEGCDSFDLLLDEASADPKKEDQAQRAAKDPIVEFLKAQSPTRIEEKLNTRIIGQPALTKSVADFLYYHALRQLHPEMPQRPLLISGPSGSGKTEVWRTVKQLYGELFTIKIIDGSNLSCDGWAGNYKLDTFIDADFTDGGILVVDEFDKLVKPKYSSGNENVSLNMQAEFLKLVEGEYQVTEKRKPTGKTSKKMGFAFAGAFEDLQQKRQAVLSKKVAHIGFHAAAASQPQDHQASCELTDEDFIAYGIMPEIVGRIATTCATQPLDEKAYIDIIRSPYSRVSRIEQVLMHYGGQTSDVVSNEELKKMIAASRNHRTGVRWVCAQVENRLLEKIREQGLFPDSCSLMGTSKEAVPLHC